MNYTILKQWETLDGTFYSNTTNKDNYDSAIGDFHAFFKPMQNDENVKRFVILLLDENGNRIERSTWAREIPVVEAEEVAE